MHILTARGNLIYLVYRKYLSCWSFFLLVFIYFYGTVESFKDRHLLISYVPLRFFSLIFVFYESTWILSLLLTCLYISSFKKAVPLVTLEITCNSLAFISITLFYVKELEFSVVFQDCAYIFLRRERRFQR